MSKKSTISKFMTEENVETTQYIPITQIVPEKWGCWFYDMLSNNAPFSWGDNNRTLITAERLANHAEECLDIELNEDGDITQKEVDEWIAEVRKLDPMYIDLEN